jgi:hypothetical protein
MTLQPSSTVTALLPRCFMSQTQHKLLVLSRSGRPNNCGSIPDRGKICFSSSKCPDRVWDPPPPQQHEEWAPEVKRLPREAEHSPLCSVYVRNEWRYTSIPLHAFMARRGKTCVYFTYTIHHLTTPN